MLDWALVFMVSMLALLVGVTCVFFAAIVVAFIPAIYRRARKTGDELLG